MELTEEDKTLLNASRLSQRAAALGGPQSKTGIDAFGMSDNYLETAGKTDEQVLKAIGDNEVVRDRFLAGRAEVRQKRYEALKEKERAELSKAAAEMDAAETVSKGTEIANQDTIELQAAQAQKDVELKESGELYSATIRNLQSRYNLSEDGIEGTRSIAEATKKDKDGNYIYGDGAEIDSIFGEAKQAYDKSNLEAENKYNRAITEKRYSRYVDEGVNEYNRKFKYLKSIGKSDKVADIMAAESARTLMKGAVKSLLARGETDVAGFFLAVAGDKNSKLVFEKDENGKFIVDPETNMPVVSKGVINLSGALYLTPSDIAELNDERKKQLKRQMEEAKAAQQAQENEIKAQVQALRAHGGSILSSVTSIYDTNLAEFNGVLDKLREIAITTGEKSAVEAAEHLEASRRAHESHNMAIKKAVDEEQKVTRSRAWTVQYNALKNEFKTVKDISRVYLSVYELSDGAITIGGSGHTAKKGEAPVIETKIDAVKALIYKIDKLKEQHALADVDAKVVSQLDNMRKELVSVFNEDHDRMVMGAMKTNGMSVYVDYNEAAKYATENNNRELVEYLRTFGQTASGEIDEDTGLPKKAEGDMPISSIVRLAENGKYELKHRGINFCVKDKQGVVWRLNAGTLVDIMNEVDRFLERSDVKHTQEEINELMVSTLANARKGRASDQTTTSIDPLSPVRDLRRAVDARLFKEHTNYNETSLRKYDSIY